MSGIPVLMSQAHFAAAKRDVQVRTYGERNVHSGNDKVSFEVGQCKAIAQVLHAHFPGHAWAVEVLADQGVAKVSIPELLGPNWGYVLHLDKLQPSDVVRAGGEILERFEIPRSSIDMAAYMSAEQKIPLLGNFRASSRSLIPS